MKPILLSGVLLVACGGDDTTLGPGSSSSGDSGSATADSGKMTDDQDSGGSTDTTDTMSTTDTVPEGPSLSELIDHSVNGAVAAWSSAAQTLVLETAQGTNPPGGFNGVGKGSKALAGVPGLDGRLLSDFKSVTFDAKSASGSAHIYLNVLVDLACDGTDIRILVVDESSMEPVEKSSGFSRYTAAASGPQWKAIGALDDLLPDHLDVAGRSLGPVSEAYPSACLVDADTGDGGMPAEMVTSAVLLVLGDSGTTSAHRWGVDRVSVDDTVWSHPGD